MVSYGEGFRIYRMRLTSGSYEFWKTPLSFPEAKDLIGKEAFITITYDDPKKAERNLNTKVIEDISDVTEEFNRHDAEKREDKEKRLKIIKEIRQIPLSRYHKWKFKISKKPKEEFNWFDKSVGTDIDPLMCYTEKGLHKLLLKCKKHRKRGRRQRDF